MKKRIGNDIQFTWHIYRKEGESQVPESFDGKDVTVTLMSPLHREVTIDDVTISEGVVTFTFKGKHQVVLGTYVAVLQENKGEDGMVTLDVVDAVTLVPHSYMEEDGDEGDVIEAASVELESEVRQGVDAYTKAEVDNLLEKKADTQDLNDNIWGFAVTYEQNTFTQPQIIKGNAAGDNRSIVLDGNLLSLLDSVGRGITIYPDGILKRESSSSSSVHVVWTDDLAAVATSGSYNDLTDKPTFSVDTANENLTITF